MIPHILTQGIPGVQLCGFLGVLDIRARAHQYDGFRMSFALPVAFLLRAPGPIFTIHLTHVAWPDTEKLSNVLQNWIGSSHQEGDWESKRHPKSIILVGSSSNVENTPKPTRFKRRQLCCPRGQNHRIMEKWCVSASR